MGVRPPTGGSRGRDAVEFGIAALSPMIDEAGLDFPADPDEVLRSLDDPEIPIDASGRSVALSVALEEAGNDRFQSERELMNSLHPVFESHRELVSTGWLSSIRSQLPL